MLYRPLGQTGLFVSEIGLGCASYWGKPSFPEKTAIGLVHSAIDRGITFFDTGASYSLGEAEPRLGRALKGVDTARLTVATKAGTFYAGGRIGRDFSGRAVTASAERSLERLGLDSIALLQLHGPSVRELDDDLLGALERLKTRGLVRAVGLNSFDPRVIDYALRLPQIGVVMVDYNVLRPEREALIARAAAAGKGVLAGMALAMGHTGGKVFSLKGPQDLWYAARGLVRHRAEVAAGRRFGFLHRQRDMTGSQAALAYVLSNPHVSCAVIGTTRLKHLEENAAASGLKLAPDLLARIRDAQGARPG